MAECCACCKAAEERGEGDHEYGPVCPYPECDYCPPRMRFTAVTLAELDAELYGVR